MRVFKSALVRFPHPETSEIKLVSQTIKKWLECGIKPGEIGVFTRSPAEFSRAEQAVENAGASFDLLNDLMEPDSSCIAIGTMHQAKGLEYRAVVVMACDEDVIPSEDRMASVVDNSDLEEVYNTERYLLYVACTRARDNLLVSAVAPGSEFLADLM